jgi:hypothetical protein
LLEAFTNLDVHYQVGGSVAGSIHGVPRSSLDVDVLVSSEPKQVDVLVNNIEEEFYVSRSHARARADA